MAQLVEHTDRVVNLERELENSSGVGRNQFAEPDSTEKMISSSSRAPRRRGSRTSDELPVI